jgi:hypothetical protein
MLARLTRGLLPDAPEPDEVEGWLLDGVAEEAPGLVMLAKGPRWAELLLRHGDRSGASAFLLQRYRLALGRNGRPVIGSAEALHVPPLAVSKHAIDRLQQRGGDPSIADTARILWALSNAALEIEAWEALPLGAPLDLSVPGGVFAAVVEPEALVATTFIDVKKLRPAQREHLAPDPLTRLPADTIHLWLGGKSGHAEPISVRA